MKDGSSPGIVFFEPWSLGDVLIAASAARELSYLPAIACHSAWHEVVRAAFGNSACPALIPVDLPYTTRNRAHALDARQSWPAREVDVVLSIRGDLRDLAAARKVFPGARIRMEGWVRFLGRKSAIVNFPFRSGLLPVQNRYRSWAKLAGVSYEQVEQTYRHHRSNAPQNGRVVIHVGAQWRSKQFPSVADVRDRLALEGYETIIVAGPGDLLPADLDQMEVSRATNGDLVELFRSAAHVITNDSGPMHLAAFLGCRTTTVVRTSPIEEWVPPGVQVIASSETPHGYRPAPMYMSDNVLPGWPTANAVAETITSSSAVTRAETQN